MMADQVNCQRGATYLLCQMGADLSMVGVCDKRAVPTVHSVREQCACGPRGKGLRQDKNCSPPRGSLNNDLTHVVQQRCRQQVVVRVAFLKKCFVDVQSVALILWRLLDEQRLTLWR